MGLSKPYRRTVRQLTDGTYANSGHGAYVSHASNAASGVQHVRSFLLLQKDVLELFDYVEPAEQNKATFSYRIHALLLRACIEVEANCKSILRANEYPIGKWTMLDYRKIERSHRMSGYEVVLPVWAGQGGTRRPFAAWGSASGKGLDWYTAYNTTKHDRHNQFHQATFEHLVNACCAVVAILYAQFRDEDFTSGASYLVCETSGDDEFAVGSYFRVRPPRDWPEDERYAFSWQLLRGEEDPFVSFDYSPV